MKWTIVSSRPMSDNGAQVILLFSIVAVIMFANAASIQAQITITPPLDITTINRSSNWYGALNRIGNHMYHTGIDLCGGCEYEKTPIKAAADGTVKLVVGLAPQGGGTERIQTWDDANNNGAVDSGELSGYERTDRSEDNLGSTPDNHGLGISIVIEHSDELYTLYGHLSAVKKEIWDALKVVGGSYEVKQHSLIAIVGRSTFDDPITEGVGTHVHFEVKDSLTLQSPRDDGSQQYTGYTPDFPDPYGYQDPLLSIYPPPNFSPTMLAIKVVGEESGSSESNRGVRVYTGPGIKYGVIGWTGLNQLYVANSTALSTTIGDSKTNRLWYRIDLPNRIGPNYGWIASEKNDGTVLVQEDTSATIIEVVGDEWRLRRDPSTPDDCSNCVRVWDNLLITHRNVLVWDGLKFVRSNAQTISGVTWHEIHLPKFYFTNPVTGCASPTVQDQCVGEIETAWLHNDAVQIMSPEATVCHTILSGDQAPVATDGTRYGLAWHWFSSEKELLLSAMCESDQTIITVGSDSAPSTGPGRTLSWGKVHAYDGSSWNVDKPVPVTCTGETIPVADATPHDSLPDFWCSGTLTGTLPTNASFFVGYTCIFTGSAWQCGCTDSACTRSFWQLQGVER